MHSKNKPIWQNVGMTYRTRVSNFTVTQGRFRNFVTESLKQLACMYSNLRVRVDTGSAVVAYIATIKNRYSTPYVARHVYFSDVRASAAFQTTPL